ncbi:UDP-3-O-N-acetylglucosamine deacetylase [Podospora aff. communis PSN243]|uniref:UDP-3-O-N-acetylglucosamine deacetylase n=1 Tax=Podospora aff. communis PSN243 TaxID=3040156 RepID=A0AAV9GTH8_9PEZI|nr:UDP-3-O-N-acetylglucosamine deacetylase [Podospora aff. communis PSN243]
MKPLITSLLLALLFSLTLAADPIRAIFLFKDVLKSNTTAIKTSGFNTLLIFGIGILSDGSIKYYSNTPGSSDITVASGGSYVGGPSLAEKVRSFKQGNTTVNRIEISMNSQNVRNLMSSPGPGENTPVYKNFVALKEAWGLDAVNNDDEVLYEVGSTVTFAKMLGKAGYKYTGAPYTNVRFWRDLISQTNSGLSGEGKLLFDRVYLQCYDGGARNDPRTWEQDLRMKIVPLVWVTNDSKPQFSTTAAQARQRFQQWHSRSALAGGGYWNDYDIEKMGLSYAEYGGVLRAAFP